VLDALERRGVAIPAAARRDGLALARWPGRFEPCPAEPRLWWDGAHNLDGVRALIETWREVHGEPPGALVLALSRDKDAAAVTHELAAAWPRTPLIATRTRSERALEPAELAGLAGAAGLAAETAPSVSVALKRALAGSGGRVLISGSLFAVGEAMEALGGAPGEWQ